MPEFIPETIQPVPLPPAPPPEGQGWGPVGLEIATKPVGRGDFVVLYIVMDDVPPAAKPVTLKIHVVKSSDGTVLTQPNDVRTYLEDYPQGAIPVRKKIHLVVLQVKENAPESATVIVNAHAAKQSGGGNGGASGSFQIKV
ncbi:MAG: hypothetical protein ACK47B_24510 [Armatimonadota bacterium]